MLRQNIACVLLAPNLVELEGSGPKVGLDPQLRDRQVPDSPNAAPAANSDGRAAVRMDRQRQGQTHVRSEGLRAETFSDPLDDTTQLSLPRG